MDAKLVLGTILSCNATASRADNLVMPVDRALTRCAVRVQSAEAVRGAGLQRSTPDIQGVSTVYPSKYFFSSCRRSLSALVSLKLSLPPCEACTVLAESL